MPSLFRRFGFLAVVAAGAALFGAGVQGVREVDTTLQVAAERTDGRTLLVRNDWNREGDPGDGGCPDAPPPHRVSS
jgi:hypothetical protein